jgi:cell division protein FtsZ
MKDAGPAWMSIGRGSGQNRATDAAKEALASPLLDVSIDGSQAVLFNVVGGNNLTLFEVNQAAEVIKQAVDPEANIIFGVAHDASMENDVRITLITTGFTAKLAPDGSDEEEDELTKLLKGLKGSEEDLDVPSFLRRPLYSHRRQAITQSMKTQANAQSAQKPKQKSLF